MGTLGEAIKWGIKSILQGFVDAISNKVISPLLELVFGYLTTTPYPDNIYTFGAPTTGPWTVFYEIFRLKVQIILPSLFTLFLSIGFFFNIFKPKQKRTTIRRAIFAFPVAISWWWFGGWFLKLNHALSMLFLSGAIEQLTNNFSSIFTTGSTVVFIAIGLYVVGLPIVAAVAFIYYIRRLAIYVYMVGMPILLMFWVLPIGPIQGWAKKMMGYFPALVLITLPTSLLLRIGAELLGSQNGVRGAIMGLSVLVFAAIIPKYMLNFSSAVGSAVRKGSMTGRAAAAGAAGAGAGAGGGGRPSRGGGGGAGGGGTTAAGGGGGRSAAAGGGGGGGGDGSVNDQHGRQTPADFSPQMSRRRRQRERAQKVGSGARKAAGSARQKASSGARSLGSRATESAAKNYYSDGNTAVGMAKDAASAARRGASNKKNQQVDRAKQAGSKASRRMSKVGQRMEARREELQYKHGRASKGDVEDRRPGHVAAEGSSEPTGDDEDPEDPGGGGRRGGGDGPPGGGGGGRQTYQRNRSSRRTGAVGQSGRQTYDRNQTDRDVGSFGSNDSDKSGSDDNGSEEAS